MKSNINRTHKNVVGFLNSDSIYIIRFEEYIYDGCLDAIEMEKIIQSFLKPQKYDHMGSWCGMSGFFIKDDIKVDTFWDDMVDYIWKINSVDKSVHEKVYEWAVTVYEEYRRENKSDNFDSAGS